MQQMKNKQQIDWLERDIQKRRFDLISFLLYPIPLAFPVTV